MPRRVPFTLTLTERDVDILKLLAELRGVPIELIAEQFFAYDYCTGARNRNPLRACRRRLDALAAERYVRFAREYDGRDRRLLVVLDIRVQHLADGSGRDIARSPKRRRVPVRCGAHHLRTVEALAEIRKEIEHRGGTVVSVKLDHDLRAESRKGRRTMRGQRFEMLPDAVLKVSFPNRGEREIAVEYVTSKYTNNDIREKRAAFARYGEAIWVAENQRTAERVRALTEAPCRVLT